MIDSKKILKTKFIKNRIFAPSSILSEASPQLLIRTENDAFKGVRDIFQQGKFESSRPVGYRWHFIGTKTSQFDGAHTKYVSVSCKAFFLRKFVGDTSF